MPNLHRRTCPCKTNVLWFSLSYTSPHSFLLTRVTLAGMHGPAFLAGHVHSQCPTCIDAHARAKRMRCGTASHTHLLTHSSSLVSHLQGCTVQLSWLVTCTAHAGVPKVCKRVHMPQLLAQGEGLRACASVMCVFVLFLFVCVCVCVCVIMYLNVNTYTLGQNIFYVRDSSVQVCMRT